MRLTNEPAANGYRLNAGISMNGPEVMQRKAHELCVQLSLVPPFEPIPFVTCLAVAWGLTIHWEAFPMFATATGFVIRTDTKEYVLYYHPFVSAERFARIIYHEAAHIILDHVPIWTPEQIRDYLRRLQRLSPDGSLPQLRGPRYSLRSERDAEALGTALTALSLRPPSLAFVIDAGDEEGVRSRIAEFFGEMGV
jgi:hypothetical protein